MCLTGSDNSEPQVKVSSQNPSTPRWVGFLFSCHCLLHDPKQESMKEGASLQGVLKRSTGVWEENVHLSCFYVTFLTYFWCDLQHTKHTYTHHVYTSNWIIHNFFLTVRGWKKPTEATPSQEYTINLDCGYLHLALLWSGEAILVQKTKFSPTKSHLFLSGTHHTLFKTLGMKPPLQDQTTLLTVIIWSWKRRECFNCTCFCGKY